ncbi:MAG: aromatic ring-hydroxylating dioxygenase subunit alpha [Rhodobacteraceae bacterium]|nr:aromatic ring-hydroxylating dioxygenase subunit alpha [Paracoccaceae bacterium]
MNDQSAQPQEANDDRVAAAGQFVREAWYYAMPSSGLKAGHTIHRAMLGEAVLVGRDRAGGVFALRDTCPHRGTLLSRGAFDGREVECPYHGWRFATDGRCTAIPSQTSDQRPQPADVRTPAYPVRESQGNIWIYMGRRREHLPPVPEVPGVGTRPKLTIAMLFDCDIDLAVAGLMDPAHGAFVHRSALWRDKASIHQKSKAFSPISENGTVGWRMDRHRASSNSRAYRILLGGAPETEITYLMPSVRIEHATTGRYTYGGLTACTPIDATRTMVHHAMYWDVGLATALSPIIRLVAWRFLDQDRRAVEHMKDGLAFDPPTMLVRDADTQVRWYYRLKRELLAAERDGRAPQNPIESVTLTWRS